MKKNKIFKANNEAKNLESKSSLLASIRLIAKSEQKNEAIYKIAKDSLLKQFSK